MQFVKRLLNKIYFYKNPNFIGVNSSDVCQEQKVIFNNELFRMPLMKDVFGKEHEYFNSYETEIPSIKVSIFNNAYCFVDKEEIFTKNMEVIADYTTQKKNPWIGQPKTSIFKRKKFKVDATIAHLSLSGLENNYYHFLTECLSRFYLIQKSGYKPDFYIISHEHTFQNQMLDFLGIRRDQVLKVKNSNYLIRAKKLIVADFINNYEPVYFRGFLSYHKQWLPSWIGNLYKNKSFIIESNNSINRIYISRSKASYRIIENEIDVIELYKKYGFCIYDLEDMNLRDQIKLFNNAQIISGIHGSGFCNMYFSNSNTIIFELYTEFYHDSAFRIISHCLNLTHYFLVGENSQKDDVHPQKENVFIDLKSLEMSLSKIISENNLDLLVDKY